MEQVNNLNNQKSLIPKDNNLEAINIKEKIIYNSIENLFEAYNNGEQRVNLLIEFLSPYLSNNLIKEQDQIKIDLLGCVNLNNKNEFISRVTEIVKPIISLVVNNPEIEIKFKNEQPLELKRKVFNIFNKYEQIGKYISYGITGRTLHIHLPDASDLIKDKSRTILFSEIENDFNNLAKVVDNNSQIKEIVASSWIVANNPNILNNFGFIINHKYDSIDKEGKESKFSSISRDEFLKRYLKNN